MSEKLSTVHENLSAGLAVNHADRVFDGLVRLIASGELAPGRPVSELQLAAKFGCSRGPVREAISRLQGQRLIVQAPNLRPRVAAIEHADVVQLFQMRAVLEGLACRLAASAMADADIVVLEEDLERWHAVLKTGAAPDVGLQELDVHRRIAAGSGNRWLVEWLSGDLYRLLSLYRRQSGDQPGRRAAAHEEHWQIVRALRARDGDLAELLMKSHIERAIARLPRGGSEPAGQA